MSIATEIERLQSAKASLKTSINAKNDSSHQIDDETIDDYADFVDNIQTGSGEDVTAETNTYSSLLSTQTATITDMELALVNKRKVIPQPDYIETGLVAWWEGEDNVDTNNRWNSRIGNDYIYQYNSAVGTNTENPFSINKTDNSYKNNCMYSLCTNNDYHIQGYTIEVVGRQLNTYYTTGNTGTSLLSFDRQCSPAIAINGDGAFKVLSPTSGTDQSIMPKHFENLTGKTCTFVLNLAELGTRNSGGYITLDYAVNGDGWYTTTRNNPAYQTSRGNHCTIMCYYAYQNTATDNVLNNSEIYSIRIYNRKLTVEELEHNFEIDKERFDIEVDEEEV